MTIAKHTEYDMINHLLKNGKLLSCNNYNYFSKDDIMCFALVLSEIIEADGVVTVGWNSSNPQIYLNIND